VKYKKCARADQKTIVRLEIFGNPTSNVEQSGLRFLPKMKSLAQYSARSSAKACFGHSPCWSCHLSSCGTVCECSCIAKIKSSRRDLMDLLYRQGCSMSYKLQPFLQNLHEASEFPTLAIFCTFDDLLLEICPPRLHLGTQSLGKGAWD